MEWRNIDGFATSYRINRSGDVQRLNRRGEWVSVIRKQKHGSAVVTVLLSPGRQSERTVNSLLYQAFRDIERRPHNMRKAVEMIDRDGRIIDTYHSVSDAARDNAVTTGCVSRRCMGVVENPFKNSDYTFRYKE